MNIVGAGLPARAKGSCSITIVGADLSARTAGLQHHFHRRGGLVRPPVSATQKGGQRDNRFLKCTPYMKNLWTRKILNA